MITQEESGLTPTQYEALKAQREHPSFEVIAHRYNLDFNSTPWAAHPDAAIAQSTSGVWAVAANNIYLFWLTGADTLYRIDVESGTIHKVENYPGNASQVAGTPVFITAGEPWGPQALPNRAFNDWTVSTVPDGWTLVNNDANNYVEEHADGMRLVSDNSLAVGVEFELPPELHGNWLEVEVIADVVITSGAIQVGPEDAQVVITKTGRASWKQDIGSSSTFVIEKNSSCDAVIKEVSCRIRYGSSVIQVTLQQSGNQVFTMSGDNGDTWTAWTNVPGLAVTVDTRLEDFATAGGIFTASEAIHNFEPGNAFDGNPWGYTYWLSDQNSCWLQYDATEGVSYIAKKYTFFANEGLRPESWTFKGSNDADTWDTLDSETSYVYTEASEEGYTFTFSNSTAYRYYRLDITDQEWRGTGVSQLYIYHDVAIGDIDVLAYPNNSFEAPTLLRYTTEGQYKIEQLIKGLVQGADYYWPYKPDSIATTLFDGKHIIAMATDLPGPATVKYDHELEEAIKMRHVSQGIIVFLFNTSLSDYVPVSVFEPRLEGEEYTNVRLTTMGDTLFLTAHVTRGSTTRPVTGYQLFTSKDGRNWSIPQFLGIDNTAIDGMGIELFQSGEYVYAVERTQIWRSYSTLFSGHSAEAVQEDISADIETYNFTMSGMLSVSVNLNNGEGQYDDHEIINGENTVALVHKHGYYVPGVTPPTTPQEYKDLVMKTDPGLYFPFDEIFGATRVMDYVSGLAEMYMQNNSPGPDVGIPGPIPGGRAYRYTSNTSRSLAANRAKQKLTKIMASPHGYSIMAWIHLHGATNPSYRADILEAQYDGNHFWKFTEHASPPRLRFSFKDDDVLQNLEFTRYPYDEPEWHRCIALVDIINQRILLYYQGEQVLNISRSILVATTQGDITYAAANEISAGSHLDGVGLANFAAWPRLLHSDEIRRLSSVPSWDPVGPVLLQAGITELDTIGDGTQLSTSPQTGQSHIQKVKRLQGRGRMGWLSDKTAASMSNYRDGQLLAGDNFDGLQDSGLATMRHFAVEAGEWTVRDNKMWVTEIVEREAVFSTFGSDLTNVGMTFMFTWPAALTGYVNYKVEALIRAIDADNCLAVVIERAAGGQFAISINDRRAGVDTALDTGTDTTGWPTGVDVDIYMRVEVRDGDIAAWMSQTDNQWSDAADVHVRARISTLNRIDDGKVIHLASALPYERGRMGLAVWSNATTLVTDWTGGFSFEQFRMFDLAPPLYLEEAIRYFAAKGGLHDLKFQSLANTTDNRWNPLTDVQITQYEDYITVGATHKDNGIHYAVHSDVNDKGSMIVEFDYEFLVGYGLGVVIGFQGTNRYFLAMIEDDNSTLNVYKSLVGTPSLRGSYPLTTTVPETGRMRVAFRQFRQSLDEASIWQAVSVYVNDRLLVTHIEKNVELFEDMSFGVAAKYGTMAKISNLNVPELNQFLETITLDPGERPLSGLMRTFQGFHVRYFVRQDGSLYVWLPKIQDKALEITDLDRDAGTAFTEDSRSIFTHIRVVGAYVQAELLRDDLVRKYGYRFIEVNNPYLLTEDECLAEAEFLLNRYEESRTTLQFSMPMVPMIEIEDRILTPEGDRIIEAYGVNWTPTQAVWSMSTRGYTFIDEADIATDDTAFLLDVTGRSELDENTILG